MTSYKWDGNTSLSKNCYNLWVLKFKIIINNFAYMCAKHGISNMTSIHMK